MAKYHEKYHNVPIKDLLVDPESFILNPESGPDSADAKPPWRLADLYPDIAQFRAIPVEVFKSQEYARKEWENLWTKSWVYAGRSSDVREVGDWFKFDLGPESIIVVRVASGKLKAFYNVCQHRGNRLVNSDFGKGATAFACIFHTWMWDIEGKLVRATDRETFRAEALRGDLNLPSVHVDEWLGFVHISMAKNPMPLSEFFGKELTQSLKAYHLEDMFTVKDVQFEVPCNWKQAHDGFNEIYHLHGLHPDGRGNVDDHYNQYDYYPNGHNRMMVPFAKVSPRLENRHEMTPIMAIFLRNAGIDPDTYKGDLAAGDARRDIQKALRQSDNAYGLDFSELTDGQLIDDWNLSLFPGITLNVHAEGTLIQTFRPTPDLDPTKAIYGLQVILPKRKEGAGAPWYFGVEDDVDTSGRTRPPRRYTNAQHTEIGALLDQDIENFAKQGKGVRSRGLKVLRFSEQEGRCQQLHAELDQYMNRGKGGE